MSGQHHHDDFAFEPVPGLPKQLPPEETILWRGAPAWGLLARKAFHVRKVAIYFAILFVWQVGARILEGAALAQITASAAWILGLSAVCLAILGGLAYAQSKATIYTLTDKRIIIRSGVALPVTINVPLKLIQGADLNRASDGSGDIAMKVDPSQRVYYTLLWPNVRPWRLAKPEPMLRALKDVDPVAHLLAKALESEAAAAGIESQRATLKTETAKGEAAPKGVSLDGPYGAATS